MWHPREWWNRKYREPRWFDKLMEHSLHLELPAYLIGLLLSLRKKCMSIFKPLCCCCYSSWAYTLICQNQSYLCSLGWEDIPQLPGSCCSPGLQRYKTYWGQAQHSWRKQGSIRAWQQPPQPQPWPSLRMKAWYYWKQLCYLGRCSPLALVSPTHDGAHWQCHFMANPVPGGASVTF